LSLAVSSFYAGIAGSLYAYYETYISPGSFTIWESIVLVCMVLVGGRQSLLGSAFGALILIAIPELLRELGEYRMLIYGAIMFLVIMFRPKGLIPPVYFLKASERRKHVLAID
jgi:branched-chain amino acid transport system permease protein